MINKKSLLLLIFIIPFITCFAQESLTIKGTLTDSIGQPIPFANIIIEVNGAQKGGCSSDFDGNYQMRPVSPTYDTFDLVSTYFGYNTKRYRFTRDIKDSTKYNVKIIRDEKCKSKD